jgi:hypothetical protein
VADSVEGDECKFAVWANRVTPSDHRLILKAPNAETKNLWVKKLEQLKRESLLWLPNRTYGQGRANSSVDESSSADSPVAG